MYRVLLVDDEPLILSGIKHMLDWAAHGCELVGTARNGKQALDEMERLRPHLVVADISMPVMNGVELLATAQQRYPETVFIMLSNLEEFDLARQSLQLRAVDYLVKNQLDENKFILALEAAKKENAVRSSHMQNSLSQETELAEHKATLALAVKRMLAQAPLSIGLEDTLYAHKVYDGFGAIQIRVANKDADTGADDSEDLSSWIGDAAEKLAGQSFGQSVILKADWNSLLLVYWGDAVDEMPEYALRFTQNLGTVAHDIFASELCMFTSAIFYGAGQGSACKAQLATMDEYFYNFGQPLLTYQDIANFEVKPLPLQGFVNRFQTELNARSVAGCEGTIERVAALAAKTPHEKAQMVWFCSKIYELACAAFCALPGETYFAGPCTGRGRLEQLECLPQVEEWMQGFCGEVVDRLRRDASKYSALLEQVQGYVRDNVEKRIMLQDVAERVGMSSAYLSVLFKKECGQSFVDFVNNAKMKRACEIIRERKLRMSEIGYALGFENAYYFSRVFRRYIGMSPTEYQHAQTKK
ncbi:response regulator [Ruminococcaceae bacterium OttesenSCG-928-A16]|nr:response regulator [Ruminococcaceae bacterium OttesenSCG-928-A16]